MIIKSLSIKRIKQQQMLVTFWIFNLVIRENKKVKITHKKLSAVKHFN